MSRRHRRFNPDRRHPMPALILTSRRPLFPVDWRKRSADNRPGFGGPCPNPKYRHGDEVSPPDRRDPRPRPGLSMCRRPGAHH